MNALRLHDMVDVVLLALAPIMFDAFLSAWAAGPRRFGRATAAFTFVHAAAKHRRANAPTRRRACIA